MYSVSSYIYIQSHLIYIQSHLIYIQSHMYSVSSYIYIFSLIIFIFSQILYIFSLILFLFSHILYIFSFFVFSRTVREDIVPQVLSSSRFRNNQIELRKRRIQKDKNTENRILNSNKNVVEKAETWKTLEEFILYSFIYFISSTVNFILMILLINQWYLESQKPLVTLF